MMYTFAMGNLEVLAPVGSFKNLKLAINSGANAVYFGVKNFNARRKAENIDINQLDEFVKIAHLHNVKTYMTLNTLIKNDEFDDVLQVIDRAIDCKVDAFIVQDIGLATYLLKHYKNIVLHASTQMGIHNLSGAKFLEDLGFKRVVLSRETKLSDIKAIKQNTNLEIEYFVQGALCVAFSGNCYFSSLCFNESGNRGECLQPCRMLFDAICDNKKVNEGFLLSTKDICMLGRLKELSDAGVVSFKIEGRLRRDAYLIQSVASYTKALNGNFHFKEEVSKLKKIFTRGDYNYGNYLKGNDDIINSSCGNHRGEKIGKVLAISPFKDLYKVEIKTDRKLNRGDGIKIVDGFKEMSLGVGNLEYSKNGNTLLFTKHRPLIGDVFLSLDSEYEKRLNPSENKIPLTIKINGRPGDSLEAVIEFDNNKLIVKSDFVCEKANNIPLSKQDFIDIFSRIKETEFAIKDIVVKIENIFIAKSLINKFKKECILRVEEYILENVRRDIKDVKKIGDCDNKYECCDSMGSIDDILICNNESVLNGEKTIIFAPEFYNQNFIENYIVNNSLDFIYLYLPVFCTGDEVEIIDRIIYLLGKTRVGVVVNNYWGLKYLNDGFRTIIGYNMNIVNDWSKNFYSQLGVDNFIRSIESNLTNCMTGGLSYEGRPTLMNLCHCPYKVSLNSKCDNCKVNNKLLYKLNDGKTFNIRRYKIINCYFELVSNKKIGTKSKNKVIDIR